MFPVKLAYLGGSRHISLGQLPFRGTGTLCMAFDRWPSPVLLTVMNIVPIVNCCLYKINANIEVSDVNAFPAYVRCQRVTSTCPSTRPRSTFCLEAVGSQGLAAPCSNEANLPSSSLTRTETTPVASSTVLHPKSSEYAKIISSVTLTGAEGKPTESQRNAKEKAKGKPKESERKAERKVQGSQRTANGKLKES